MIQIHREDMLEYEASVKSWNSQTSDQCASSPYKSDPFYPGPPPPIAGGVISAENVLVHTCTQDPIYRRFLQNSFNK